MGKRTTQYILFGLIIVNTLFGFYLFYSKINETTFVSFDMKGSINLFLEQLAKQNLDSSTIDTTTKKFNDVLDQSIKEYSAKHNAIIFVSPAIVNGTKDITLEIQSSISEKMVN